MGNAVSKFRTLHEVVEAARARLSDEHWDYLMGGADTETSLKRNRMALDALAFRPRVLNDVSEVDLSTTFLGAPLRMPIALAPLGSNEVFEPGGGVTVARASEELGVAMIQSSSTEVDLETVAAAAAGTKLYQLYLQGDQDWMDGMIERVVAAGYLALCLTVDTAVYTRRERDIVRGFMPPSAQRTGPSHLAHQAQMTWDTVAHVKQRFDIPLVLKGINRGDDATRAVDAGVDVVYVSNHGGRQLDHGRGCLDALPEVVAAVQGRVPVVVDGGVMRGTDVLKALSLGADLVGVGRLQGLAMAAGGVPALLQTFRILEFEIRTNMALLGATTLTELEASLIEQAPPLPNPHVLSAFPLLDEQE
jgi:glycolate oxidase